MSDHAVMDSAERALLRSTFRHVLEGHEPAQVPSALHDQGWVELLDANPATAISILSEEAGRTRSAAPVTDLAVLWGAGIVSDPSTVPVLDGLALAGAHRAERFLWFGDGIAELAADEVSLAPIDGIDPSIGLQRVQRNGVGRSTGSRTEAESATAAGRRALASQMIGASEQMLNETLVYVGQRHQFGRAIGSFQSVKHRLADVAVAVAAARSAVAAAWENADSEHGGTLAIAAKCLAGRAHGLASTHCFQVHGGIAFTAEHGFQVWVRRGFVLDLLLGDQKDLTVELGRRLIAAGELPRLPRLTDVGSH